MSGRGRLAIAVLIVWGATLGWHAKRVHFRPPSAMVAEGARTIPPGAAYYSVFRGDRRVGWAQSEVDTLPAASGFSLRDLLVLRESLVPGEEPLRLVVEARLGPTLALRSFRLDVEGIPGIRRAEGEVRSDTVLALELAGEDALVRSSLSLQQPVMLAAAWPLRLAAERGLRRGDRFRLPIVDPLSASQTMVDLTVLAAAMKSYPDSVTAVDGAFVTAREDTVRAWWIEQEIAGFRFRSWIDEDGRILSTETPLGLRLERTAFEFALFGDSVPEERR